MKLISKTLVYYLLISLPLLVIAGLLSYYLIKSELRDGTDEALIIEKTNAEKLIRSLKDIKTIYISPDSLSNIKPVTVTKNNTLFSDTILYNSEERENINARILRGYYAFNGNNYQITLVKTTIEEEELLEGILAAFALIISFLIVSFVIVNWLLSKTLWKPFYNTLSQLNYYDIKNHKQHYLPTESTLEFAQLNTALNKMMDQIYSDYIQQKEFTENASHEMQTPLAVVKANLSLLMQSPNLKEEEMNYLQAIDNTIKKISSLNKALILLSKIENNQFNESGSINIKALISKTCDNFIEVIHSKNLSLELNLRDDVLLKINPSLGEILVTNLLQNAIRHNTENGKITITLKANQLTIANTGEPLSIPDEELFLRFKKNDASKESLGLGLAIVNSICKSNSINIGYSFQNNLHVFTLNF